MDLERRLRSRGTGLAAASLVACSMIAIPVSVHAQDSATVAISVKNHSFQPTQVRAPANKRITIRVRNLDPAPMEFESVSLRVEKVVAANSEGVLNIRPLAPGRYEFFDDYHQQTRGTLVVE
jgi:hypothetical protein